jgi:hypothetical protein
MKDYWVGSTFQELGFSFIACSSVVRGLVCQPTGPGSIPGMSHSENAITRTNLIMLLPPNTFWSEGLACAVMELSVY